MVETKTKKYHKEARVTDPPQRGADKKGADYELFMGYDNLHNITSKIQTMNQTGVQFDGTLHAGYELNYKYNTERPHQIETIADDEFRYEEGEDKKLINKKQQYVYDANGNLIYIHTNTKREEEGVTGENTHTRRLLWDEENRLLAINDNGYVSNYWYDAGGERVVKTSGENELVYLNAAFSGGETGTGKFTAYINPYLVVSPQGRYTKHIYIGSQRIVSKLGDLQSFGQDPRRVAYAGQDVDGGNGKVDYTKKYNAAYDSIKSRYENTFDIPFKGKKNDDPVNGEGFCCRDNAALRSSFSPPEEGSGEAFQYYYHSDHLGSTSLITNLDGEVVQHVEYIPFGEVFIEERNNTWNTPFLFNAKELDEETGLYYYGARYYDARTSLWLSVDPLAEKKPWMSSYAYCANNPVNRIDPTGKYDYEIDLTSKKITRTGEKKSPDRLIITKENGDKVESKEFASGTIKGYGTRAYSKDGNYSYLRVRGDDNGTKMFEFLADNTDIEWGQIKTGISDEKGLNFLTTSYSDERNSGSKYLFNSQLKYEYYIREWNHNHPGKSIPVPSGMKGTTQEGEGDIRVASDVSEHNLRKGYKAPTFNIYMKGYGYNSYTKDSQVSDFENIYSIFGMRPQIK